MSGSREAPADRLQSSLGRSWWTSAIDLGFVAGLERGKHLDTVHSELVSIGVGVHKVTAASGIDADLGVLKQGAGSPPL